MAKALYHERHIDYSGLGKYGSNAKWESEVGHPWEKVESTREKISEKAAFQKDREKREWVFVGLQQ